ncbi:MAG: type I glyceraldehyde-3-phosphate dehydrogenase [Chitinivibrionales bacterium]|nr:type I glyceraldehyde-3-phosphate dehydrogenase [Chitinivibrionales bacterium]
MARLAINGLGRIGRAVLKIASDMPDMEVVAVNDLLPAENLAYLLKFDSVYGRFHKPVKAEGEHLKVGDTNIRMLNSKEPSELPWEDMKIDVALECTGHFTNKEGLEKHLKAGAKYAILSAPSKGDGMKFVVPGVNHAEKSDTMFSTASCTTNCITPVIEIMKRRFGVKKAIMSTIHAYTSTQQIVDGPSKKVRRGRAAATNLVPTSTGAAKATTKVITDLEGLFDGVAVRVPIPVGSISDIVCITVKSTSIDEINNAFREESETERYKDILGVSDENIVSSDIVQDPRGSIVDLTMTKVIDGDLVKIMSWYDNEWGYAAQMVRESNKVAKFLS